MQPGFNYKSDTNRYQHYYRDLMRFYKKPVTQVSTAVLFTLSTIIFFAIFAIKPTLETISELLRKIEDQRSVLEKAQRKVAALQTAQQQLEQIREYEAALEKAFPAKTDVQDLIQEIEALASQVGVPLESLRISKVVYPEKSPSGGEWNEITFSLSFKAAYPTSKQFIDSLSKLPRYITVESVSYKQDQQVSDNTSAGIQTSVNCKAYVASKK